LNVPLQQGGILLDIITKKYGTFWVCTIAIGQGVKEGIKFTVISFKPVKIGQRNEYEKHLLLIYT